MYENSKFSSDSRSYHKIRDNLISQFLKSGTVVQLLMFVKLENLLKLNFFGNYKNEKNCDSLISR